MLIKLNLLKTFKQQIFQNYSRKKDIFKINMNFIPMILSNQLQIVTDLNWNRLMKILISRL